MDSISTKKLSLAPGKSHELAGRVLMGGDYNIDVVNAQLEAELARTRIELDTAKYNEAHWKDCAMKMKAQLEQYLKQDKGRKT